MLSTRTRARSNCAGFQHTALKQTQVTAAVSHHFYPVFCCRALHPRVSRWLPPGGSRGRPRVAPSSSPSSACARAPASHWDFGALEGVVFALQTLL